MGGGGGGGSTVYYEHPTLCSQSEFVDEVLLSDNKEIVTCESSCPAMLSCPLLTNE